MNKLAQIWVLCAGFVASAGGLQAQTNSLAEQIPPLRPPRPEIPPSFWDLYGTGAIIAGILILLIASVVIWLLTRPKPPVVIAPFVQARQALDALRQQPEDGITLSRVSQVLRRYVTSAFDFSSGELTTAEFCRVIAERGNLGKSLTDELGNFLRECDQRKFSPPKPMPEMEAVPKALKLVENVEARRQQLRQSAADLPPIRGASKAPRT